MANWYCSHARWSSVAVWVASTAYSVGDLRRQTAAFGTLTAGNERVFRCTTAGTSGATEPSWTLTKGATTSDGSVVWTEVTGNETYMFVGGGTWTAPHARLNSTASWASAGDTLYVGSDHTAESWSSSCTISFSNGSKTNPLHVLCVTPQTSAPVQADLVSSVTGKVLTTSSNALAVNGFAEIWGVEFSAGSGATAAGLSMGTSSASILKIEHGKLTLGGTSSFGASLQIGSNFSSASPEALTLINSDISFGAADNGLAIRTNQFTWRGGNLVGTVPTQLLAPASGNSSIFLSVVDIRDVDLNSGGTWTSKFLVNLTNCAGWSKVSLTNCKLATSLGALTTGTLSGISSMMLDVVCTDSTSNVTVREEHYRYQGSAVQDTTNYRTGGSSDGTTPFSWKIVTLAGNSYLFPFECPDIFVPIFTAGTYTVTMYIGSGGTLNTNDVGFSVEYLGASTSPLGTYANTLPGVLAGNTAITTDSSSWNGTAATTPQKVQLSVTVNNPCVVRVRPLVMKASATVYIDPKIDIGSTSQRQFALVGGFMNEEAGGSGGSGAMIMSRLQAAM